MRRYCIALTITALAVLATCAAQGSVETVKRVGTVSGASVAPATAPLGVVSLTEARSSPVLLVRSGTTATAKPKVAPARVLHPRTPSQPSTPPQHSPTGDGYHGSIPDLIRAYFPASEEPRALCTAKRESGFNPYARNPRSGAGGVFQWLPSTWRVVSRMAGYGGASVFSARANIATAAYIVTRTHYRWSPWFGGCV